MRAAIRKRGFSLTQLLLSLGALLAMALLLPTLAATLVNRSRLARAQEDSTQIAAALRAFTHDTGVIPGFRLWRAREVPVQTDGVDVLVGPGETPRAEVHPAWLAGIADTLHNQLADNVPGYPRQTTASATGWRGPYLSAETSRPDPWGNRYLVNIGAVRHAESRPDRVVWALSAGPNGVLETPFLQPKTESHLGGDDVGARVW